MAFIATTLFASRFTPHPVWGDRFTYPIDDHGNNFSVDLNTGEPRPGGLPNTGPSEAFFWEKGSGRAFLDAGTMGWTVLVDESR